MPCHVRIEGQTALHLELPFEVFGFHQKSKFGYEWQHHDGYFIRSSNYQLASR
jgi:hypothetical protein